VPERRPSDVDIDHITSLAEAWRTGAARWTRPQRQVFANDPRNLLAVSRGVNRSKGDQNASAWRPPLTRYHCAFARIVITVKASYRLTVTDTEKHALKSMLATCAGWTPLAPASAGPTPVATQIAEVRLARRRLANARYGSPVVRRPRPAEAYVNAIDEH
jgi:hypothetical protein